MQQIKASIIIPTLNEEGHIKNLLTNLKEQDQGFEIIIVDGGSKDKTIKLIKKFPNVKLLKFKNQVALQRHKGAASASGKILIFLDADVKLPADFLQKSLKDFKKRKLKIACPYYFPTPFSPLIFSIYAFFNLVFFLFQKIAPSGAGSCIFVDKIFYMESGGFNQNYKFEDIEFIRRAAKISKFGMLKSYIFVSDRRFRNKGILRMLLTYLLLSFLFLIGAFKIANRISYSYDQDNLK